MGSRVRTTSDLAKVEREPLHVQLGSLPYAVAPTRKSKDASAFPHEIITTCGTRGAA
jgi:hypothetical protein